VTHADHRPDGLALQHLRAELDYLRALLQAHLRRMQQQGLLPPPDTRFPGTSIASPEIEARLWNAINPSDLLGVLDIQAAAEIVRTDELRLDIANNYPDLPLPRLKRAFQLDEAEYLVLLLSVAADFDPTFPRLFGYLQNHFERQYATLQVLVDAVTPLADAIGLRWVLDPEATLRHHALIRLDSKKEHIPVSHRAIIAEPRIVRFIQGFKGLDEKLGGLARLEAPLSDETAQPILTAKDQAALETLVRQVDEDPRVAPIPYFKGSPGAGKHLWSHILATRMNRRHLRVELNALVAEYGSLELGLRVVLREARLQDAMLCFDGWARLIEPRFIDDAPSRKDNGPRLDASRTFQRILGGDVDPETHRALSGVDLFTLTSEDPLIEPPILERPVKVFALAMPDLNASMALWKHFLPRDRPKAAGLTVKRLAQSFRLSPGHVQEAIQEATAELPDSEPVSYEHLSAAIKRQTRHRLGENASLVQADYAWTDLVVPPDVDLQLRELVGRWRSKSLVFETWGLGRRFATGQGISVLFEGPPGTGKTMAASIVAKELDLDLYQIDLSKVINRYIGETEKNLARIFDEAERSRVMLLFDEADSLFSSRTEVKSANDRYANLEVNYLLQRVEHFTGIAILTTNFPTALDEAFRRRIAMRVTFPKPQMEERKRLWDSMLTNKSILAPKLDTEDLAYEFELAGGHIKNAVLRGAFIAATRGCLIDQELLRIAARIELKEQGLLVHGSPYDELRARE
jgi:SpoVK/Ycf46/Vps4 family AAA+-type ATPase